MRSRVDRCSQRSPEALTRVQELEDMLSAIGAKLSQPTPVGLPS